MHQFPKKGPTDQQKEATKQAKNEGQQAWPCSNQSCGGVMIALIPGHRPDRAEKYCRMCHTSEADFKVV